MKKLLKLGASILGAILMGVGLLKLPSDVGEIQESVSGVCLLALVAIIVVSVPVGLIYYALQRYNKGRRNRRHEALTLQLKNWSISLMHAEKETPEAAIAYQLKDFKEAVSEYLAGVYRNKPRPQVHVMLSSDYLNEERFEGRSASPNHFKSTSQQHQPGDLVKLEQAWPIIKTLRDSAQHSRWIVVSKRRHLEELAAVSSIKMQVPVGLVMASVVENNHRVPEREAANKRDKLGYFVLTVDRPIADEENFAAHCAHLGNLMLHGALSRLLLKREESRRTKDSSGLTAEQVAANEAGSNPTQRASGGSA